MEQNLLLNVIQDQESKIQSLRSEQKTVLLIIVALFFFVYYAN